MAFVLITCLLNTIQFHFLQPLPCLIYDDREMIESLCKKLRFLQSFLEDSDEKNSNNPQARRALETEIRGVVLDAEGKIESKLRQVYLCGNEDLERRLKAWSLHETLRQVMREIESIEWRIQIGIGSSNHFAELQITNTKPDDSFSKQYLESSKNVMVGCDDEFDNIMNKLISHSKQLEVISIMGMGGIGKTTLARRVYGNPKMIARFDIRAWATVSQEYNFQKVVHELLDCIVKKHKRSIVHTDDPAAVDSDEKDISGEPLADDSDEPLESQLRKKLMGQRYLIVIDDIWGTKAWDEIRRCFPEEDCNRSRILLTTRLKQVADNVSSGNNNSHHKQFLSPNESWNLFYKKVFDDNKVSLEFESVGRHIVEKCQGLPPLTIIVAAGLFTSINKSSLNQWRIVTESLNSLLSMDPEEKCSKVVSLSYYNLPPHLKVCFLYFGVFPEDCKISVKKLIRLWVAEGFLKLELNKTTEEVAESYLQDLIDRGLVQIDNWSSDGKMKACKLHDVLHSFCLREAQREKLLDVINNVEVAGVDNSIITSKVCRWISNQLSDLEWPIAVSKYETHTSNDFHSILYFPKGSVSICKPFPCFKLLRVLDIASTAILEVIPSGIVDLFNLRYLALTTNASLQDFQWFKLRSLQTFILHGCGDSRWSLPNILSSYYEASSIRGSPHDTLDLPRLRHVDFTGWFSLCLPKSVQGNLQTISWLNLPHCMLAKPDFKRIPNVKKLGIYIETSPVLKRVMLPLGSLDGLVDLLQLDNLKIEVQEGDRHGYDFELPVAFPSNLKKLTLYKTCLPLTDMSIIATLPNLEVLKLKRWAFLGSKWTTTENEFCKLKNLQIEWSDLMHWRVDEADHFPILERLILSDCRNLEHIPDSFADITTLHLIELSCCHSSLVKSAKQIQEEQWGYGNDKLVVRHFLTRKMHWGKSLMISIPYHFSDRHS